MIDGTTSVKLTDLPNSLLGLPFYYRSYVIEQRKIQVINIFFFNIEKKYLFLKYLLEFRTIRCLWSWSYSL